MAKRLVLSVFVAVVVCALTFYLAYFAALIFAAATGPLNPPNDHAMQSSLRHIALPVSVGVAVVTFVLAFWYAGKRDPDRKKLAKVIAIR